MRKIIPFLLGLLLFLACESDSHSGKKGKSGGNLRLAIYSVNFDEYIFPPSVNNILEKSLASIFYTGLFHINGYTLEVENALCKTWEVDNTGLNYIFKIDTTAQFHKNACFGGNNKTRNLTAYDVKYTFHILANPKYSALNFTNTVYHIKGAKDYFSLTDDVRDTSRIEGIQVIDNETIRITLDKPSPRFIENLANTSAAIIPYEAVEMYGDKSTVGIGPFRYEADSLEFRFIKCEHYNKYDSEKEKLPYLDTIIITRVNDLEESFQKFANYEIDAMLLVPAEEIPGFLKRLPEDIEYEISESNVVNLKGVGKRYNIIRTNIKGLYTNKLNIFEMAEVYNTEKRK